MTNRQAHPPTVSLIMTVFNEGRSIGAVLETLASQTRPPDEIVIVDGGSTDGTLAILHDTMLRLPLVVLEQPGCNISEGRNIAIQAARGPIIAATDAGTRLPADWLEQLTAPFAA
ncbi:MAG: glycosyltransferase, partial [Anaerolineae bacterium]|nr:glycosyltransferase [Anaerolineae bacterium]